MKLLLTGATGRVGRHMLPRLVVQGHDVRAVARSEVAAEHVKAAGAEPVLDLLRDGSQRSLPVLQVVDGGEDLLRFGVADLEGAAFVPLVARWRGSGVDLWLRGHLKDGLEADSLVPDALARLQVVDGRLPELSEDAAQVSAK